MLGHLHHSEPTVPAPKDCALLSVAYWAERPSGGLGKHLVANTRSSQGPSGPHRGWSFELVNIKRGQAARSSDLTGPRGRSASHLPPTTALVCQKSLWSSGSDQPTPGRAARRGVAGGWRSKRGQGAATHLRAGAGVALQPGVILPAGAAALRRLQQRGERPVKRQRARCLEWRRLQPRSQRWVHLRVKKKHKMHPINSHT